MDGKGHSVARGMSRVGKEPATNTDATACTCAEPQERRPNTVWRGHHDTPCRPAIPGSSARRRRSALRRVAGGPEWWLFQQRPAAQCYV